MGGTGAQLSTSDGLREHDDTIPKRRIEYPHGLSIELSSVESVPIRSILPGDSPRLAGEDHAHAQVLANIEGRLPPIVVHRQSMRVIDGSHRCLAALLRGQENIEVRFFEGPEELLFLIAVRENIAHGLPLSRADREAAARRVLAAQPRWSDRAVAAVTGLAAKTVGSLRRIMAESSTEDSPQLNTRVGRDGRVRPVDYAQGRLRAGEVVTAHPDMPLREVARKAGVSVATARDVRQRIQRGADPLPPRLRLVGVGSEADEEGGREREAACKTVGHLLSTRARSIVFTSTDWSVVRPKLLRDPLLKYSESGRALFRWYDTHAIDAKDLMVGVEGVPPHWVDEIATVARSCGELWLRIADELEKQRQEA
ncbi:ParB/RepB/Spo0J family partition protein [Streptomyces lushanensis]|uniref:ParB/RepB/Spo0J family partition protein n=1 Tax=Streptomyces lushanensis TaxID=1434255 RepID=UPI0009A04178|nr:ParB/RepB/Spo0J family partition protein [Streptomyces lushanensis]